MASVSHSMVSTEVNPPGLTIHLQSSSYHPGNTLGDYTQLLWNMLFIVTDVIDGAVAVMNASTKCYSFFIRRGSNYLLRRGQWVHVALFSQAGQAD